MCLVSSRGGRRWVIPKGRIEPQQTPQEAAQAEAWEEAGVLGRLPSQSIGQFSYDKLGQTFLVEVFYLDVESIRDVWPERHGRERVWVSFEEACCRVSEPELRAILGQFAATQVQVASV